MSNWILWGPAVLVLPCDHQTQTLGAAHGFWLTVATVSFWAEHPKAFHKFFASVTTLASLHTMRLPGTSSPAVRARWIWGRLVMTGSRFHSDGLIFTAKRVFAKSDLVFPRPFVDFPWFGDLVSLTLSTHVCFRDAVTCLSETRRHWRASLTLADKSWSDFRNDCTSATGLSKSIPVTLPACSGVCFATLVWSNSPNCCLVLDNAVSVDFPFRSSLDSDWGSGMGGAWRLILLINLCATTSSDHPWVRADWVVCSKILASFEPAGFGVGPPFPFFWGLLGVTAACLSCWNFCKTSKRDCARRLSPWSSLSSAAAAFRFGTLSGAGPGRFASPTRTPSQPQIQDTTLVNLVCCLGTGCVKACVLSRLALCKEFNNMMRFHFPINLYFLLKTLRRLLAIHRQSPIRRPWVCLERGLDNRFCFRFLFLTPTAGVLMTQPQKTEHSRA